MLSSYDILCLYNAGLMYFCVGVALLFTKYVFHFILDNLSSITREEAERLVRHLQTRLNHLVNLIGASRRNDRASETSLGSAGSVVVTPNRADHEVSIEDISYIVHPVS